MCCGGRVGGFAGLALLLDLKTGFDSDTKYVMLDCFDPEAKGEFKGEN